NSGVIHSGIYYEPNSLKANFSKTGNCNMMTFCQREGISFKKSGKLIVAVKEKELPILDWLYKRGIKNGLPVKQLTQKDITVKEPHLNALKGVYVPSTGVVNYKDVAEVFTHKVKSNNNEILLDTKVENIETYVDFILIKTNQGNFKTKFMINCAGLYSDKIAEHAGIKVDMKIIPFRGEYFKLKEEKKHLVKSLIYPVPNPKFPFLGVHFTRGINNEIFIGPNAVPSLKREGYAKKDFDIKEFYEVLKYKPFWTIAYNNMDEGIKEILKSFSKKLFLKEVNNFFPQLTKKDLIPSSSGVRAQAIRNDGKMLDDFFIAQTNHACHILNAPSPAATASLEIGKYVIELIEKNKIL